MTAAEIADLRKILGLSQVEFGRLFDIHFMTVSKWERGILKPSPYQVALMRQFHRTAEAQQLKVQQELKNLLVGAGVVAALFFLLRSAGK